MKRLLGLLLPLVVGASVLATAPAATAGNTSNGDVLLYASDQSMHRTECSDSANFYIGLGPTADYADWQADVTITKPTGGLWTSTTLSPSEFLGYFGRWCAGKDPAGAYKVTVEFTGYNAASEVETTKTLTTTMTMTVEPDVTTSVAVRTVKLGKKKWGIAGRLLEEGTPWRGKKVALQMLYRGAWRDIISASSNSNGVVAFVAKPTKAFTGKKFRLHFAGSGYVRSSSSRVFKLPPR